MHQIHWTADAYSFMLQQYQLDLGSLTAARKTISNFLDKEMSQNDEVAIASASGQIGFLQQLTDNKTVLRNALQRMTFQPYHVLDSERPMMTEYHALLIDRYDRDVTDYFIEEVMRNYPARAVIKLRLKCELAQPLYCNKLRGSLRIRSSVWKVLFVLLQHLPGRKLVFFLLGGFFLDNRNTDVTDKLRRITSAAARSGAVIH